MKCPLFLTCVLAGWSGREVVELVQQGAKVVNYPGPPGITVFKRTWEPGYVLKTALLISSISSSSWSF